MEFDTANGRVTVKHGIRAMASPWDDVTDFMCMEQSPDLLSTGEHCLLSTFSHVWVNKKFPCFISKGGRYIIIFDLQDVMPVYSANMEDSAQMLGTFEFFNNCFCSKTGVYINDDGEVCLDIRLAVSYTHLTLPTNREV